MQLVRGVWLLQEEPTALLLWRIHLITNQHSRSYNQTPNSFLSTNQSTIQSTNQLTFTIDYVIYHQQSPNQPINQFINQINQPSTNQPIKQSTPCRLLGRRCRRPKLGHKACCSTIIMSMFDPILNALEDTDERVVYSDSPQKAMSVLPRRHPVDFLPPR